MIKRIFWIVLDGLGVGELPDAEKYGDKGSNTLANTAAAVGGLDIPLLQRWGIGNIIPVPGVDPSIPSQAAFGKMAEISAGKDTTSGHWEMAGLITRKSFPTFPHGFPPDLIAAFESKIGRKVIGNRVASGTEILDELGELHLRTGFPIVYTSADSVFQLAAHEEVIPVRELYQMCRIARELLQGEQGVGRVIARPFKGSNGKYQRTAGRVDYSLPPSDTTVLDLVKASGREVIGVGKIHDIFAEQGITDSYSTESNHQGMNIIQGLLRNRSWEGIVMANLVDFDSLWGHRNDPVGFARELAAFDRGLEQLQREAGEGEMIILCGDHGCDPTTASTDHSREYVPILIWFAGISPGINLGTRSSMADVAATIVEMWDLPALTGTSMANQLAIGGGNHADV